MHTNSSNLRRSGWSNLWRWLLFLMLFCGLVAVQALSSKEFKLVDLRGGCLCTQSQTDR